MILATSRRMRVYAFAQPADLRLGYDGLYGIVQGAIGGDVLGGDLSLFVNRRRDACKVLVWDGTGLCIVQKRLERGRFAALWRDDASSVRLTTSGLGLFIEGCTRCPQPREQVGIYQCLDASILQSRRSA